MTSVFDLTSQHDDVESKIAAGLERLSQAFRVLAWDRAKSHGLSPIQLQLLVYLRHHPARERRVSTLAQVFDLTQATISDAVSTLEAKGYLGRRPWASDRRVVVLALSESGVRLAEELESWADPIKTQLAGLPDEAKLEFMQRVMDLIESLQGAGVVSVARMCRSCRYFRRDAHAGAAPHHCILLDKPLAETDLRLDCPEHEPLPARPL